jgi:hypothetical protein
MVLFGRWRRGSVSLVLLIAAAVAATGCQSPPPAESEAVTSFKKEIRETGDRLAPVLVDSLAMRDPRLVRKTLRTLCATADKSSTPYSCGITVLDKHGITLASATPAAPLKRLNYSRYEAVMSVVNEKKTVNTVLYLQDHSRLFVVGIPMLRESELLGVLVLTFDSNDLQKRTGLTEQEFRDLKLN